MTNKQTTPFTRKQVSAYISEQGTKCPVCGSTPTAWGDPEFDSSIPALTQDAVCFHCGTRWVDVWTLTNAIVLDDTNRPAKPALEIQDQFEVLDQYEEDEDRYTWGWEKE